MLKKYIDLGHTKIVQYQPPNNILTENEIVREKKPTNNLLTIMQQLNLFSSKISPKLSTPCECGSRTGYLVSVKNLVNYQKLHCYNCDKFLMYYPVETLKVAQDVVTAFGGEVLGMEVIL